MTREIDQTTLNYELIDNVRIEAEHIAQDYRKALRRKSIGAIFKEIKKQARREYRQTGCRYALKTSQAVNYILINSLDKEN